MKKEDVYIFTNSGICFYPFNPNVSDININDIACHLSKMCRYTGAPDHFYSVAQHSYIIAEYLQNKGADRTTILAGLLHDAAEAYFGDVSAPLKATAPEFIACEKELQSKIYEKYGVEMNPLLTRKVHILDSQIRCNEMIDLFSHHSHLELAVNRLDMGKIAPWHPIYAEAMFLDMFRQAWGKL